MRDPLAGMASCGSCQWAEPGVMDGDQAMVVQCRRYPPQVTVLGYGDEAVQAWPQVEATDWCGEYTPSSDTPTLEDNPT